jgi:ketosteroid isomerase-like protein
MPGPFRSSLKDFLCANAFFEILDAGMSQENVDFVKGLLAGTAAMDKQAMLAMLPESIPQVFDPEIEWIEDPQRADGHTYRGHAGVRESWERWLEQWEEYGYEAERFIDCGDDVLVVAREKGRGATSGATVSARIYSVITLRDGKILRYREFYDEEAAFEAAGLPSRGSSARDT